MPQHENAFFTLVTCREPVRNGFCLLHTHTRTQVIYTNIYINAMYMNVFSKQCLSCLVSPKRSLGRITLYTYSCKYIPVFNIHTYSHTHPYTIHIYLHIYLQHISLYICRLISYHVPMSHLRYNNILYICLIICGKKLL